MTESLESFLSSLERRALLATPLPEASDDLITAQGGVPLGRPGELWPEHDGRPLFPILSVRTSELPFVPSVFEHDAYLVIFIKKDEYEVATNDGSLVLRRYQDMAELVPLAVPPGAETTRLPLGFKEVRDFPDPSVISDALEERPELRGAYKQESDLWDSAFPCADGIKIGGYPRLIQETAFLKSLDPDFAMQIDGTDLYSYGDSGIGYLDADLSYLLWESF